MPRPRLTDAERKEFEEATARSVLKTYLTSFVKDLDKAPPMPIEEIERRVQVIARGIRNYKKGASIFATDEKRGRPPGSGDSLYSHAFEIFIEKGHGKDWGAVWEHPELGPRFDTEAKRKKLRDAFRQRTIKAKKQPAPRKTEKSRRFNS